MRSCQPSLMLLGWKYVSRASICLMSVCMRHTLMPANIPFILRMYTRVSAARCSSHTPEEDLVRHMVVDAVLSGGDQYLMQQSKLSLPHERLMGVQSVEETGVGVSWSKTGLPQGEYMSSWGQEGVREVAKQFAGEFTLKSGGQVSAHTSCRLPPVPNALKAGTVPDFIHAGQSCALDLPVSHHIVGQIR